ncbi:MAG: MerR family transcriptional regulator [Chloroflexota bacterium]|nr:MerR family transcriptional regulator [Chloroflexota bacterium]
MAGQTPALMTIGQFATLTRLSVKALHLYAGTGLLTPAWVDHDTGYRYYRPEQAARARQIRLLRLAGMPLPGIAAFLADPRVSRFDAFSGEEARREAEQARRRRYVRRVIVSIYAEGEEPMDTTMTVETKTVPAQPYLSERKTVTIGELEPFIIGTIGKLVDRAGDRAAGSPFTLFWEPVNDEAAGSVEVCLPVSGDGERDGELPAGPVAWVMTLGEQTEFPAILGAYEAIERWMKDQGREMAGPPREIYHSGPDDPEPRMEIAWPLRG